MAPRPLNTEEDLPFAPGVEEDGEFSWEDFETIGIAPAVLQMGNGASKTSAAKARDVVKQRLLDMLPAGQHSTQDARALASAIVKALPNEAMFEPVVKSLDLRPYVAKVARTTKDVTDFFGVRGPAAQSNYGQGLRDRLGEWMPAVESYTQEVADELVPDGSTPGAFDAARARLAQWDEDEAGLGPAAVRDTALGILDPVTGQPLEGAAAIDAAQTPMFSERVAMPTFPQRDFEELLRIGQADYETILKYEESEANFTPDGQRVGEFDVTLDYATEQQKVGPRGQTITTRVPKQMSVRQALDYIHKLTPSELTKMQRQLEDAGYYEQVKGNYEAGNQWDPATEAAWQLALSDSMRRNQSIVETINQRKESFAAQEQELAQLPVLNREALRTEANKIGANAIGRELTEQEVRDVERFLVRRNSARGDRRPVRQFGAFGREMPVYALPEISAETGFADEDVAAAFEAAPSLRKERDRQFMRYSMDYAYRKLLPDVERGV